MSVSFSPVLPAPGMAPGTEKGCSAIQMADQGSTRARPTAQPALQYGGGASTVRGAWCTPGQLGFLSSPLHDFIQTDLFQAVALTASELTINSNVFRQLSAPREGMRSRI